MSSRVAKLIAVLIACSGMACPSQENAQEFARQQAEAARKPPTTKAVKIDTALQSGVHLACADLLPAAELATQLGEKEPVTITDLTSGNPDATATCSIRRGGKPLDEKAQARIVEKGGRLGVMGGDELCNLTLYCSVPADEEALKQRCATEESLGNHTLGVFSCVKVTPKGEFYGYTYKLIDPDSKCTIMMRGGPSVVEEPLVQACSRAAMKLIGPESLHPSEAAGEPAGEPAAEQAAEPAAEQAAEPAGQ
jgi:hypothetical protein